MCAYIEIEKVSAYFVSMSSRLDLRFEIRPGDDPPIVAQTSPSYLIRIFHTFLDIDAYLIRIFYGIIGVDVYLMRIFHAFLSVEQYPQNNADRPQQPNKNYYGRSNLHLCGL